MTAAERAQVRELADRLRHLAAQLDRLADEDDQ